MSILARIGRSWRDAGRDIVLIVISIMIAFGVDAWWDGRLEAARATGHLGAIQKEYEGNLAQLELSRSEIDRARAATRQLLVLMADPRPDVGPDSLSRLLNSTYDSYIASPEGGALAALVGSGDIRLIEDDSLAYLLAGWPLLMEEIRGDGRVLYENRERELRPRLIALGVPESAIAAHIKELDLPNTRFRIDPAVVLNDAAIESTLVSRLVRLQLLGGLMDRAVAHASQILGRLEGS